MIEDGFVCVYCCIKGLSLTKKVSKVIKTIIHRVEKESESIVIDPFYFPKLDNDGFIELRCVKIDSRGYKILGENTFPDFYQLKNS